MDILVFFICLVVGALAVEPEKLPEPITVAQVENNAEITTSDDGEKLVEGDMVTKDKGQEGSDRNAIYEEARWPKQGNFVEIPYTFAYSISQAAKTKVMESIADYAAWTCIKFVPRSTQADYIEFFKGNGCYSSVGKTGGKQVLSLGTGCDGARGTATHEMMHAIGFSHEQSRQDRDSYVSIIKDNINPNSMFNFHKCNSCKDPTGLGYDYNSVMHYDEKAFSINNKPTIVPRQSGAKIGQRGGLCDMDVKKLNWMYKCNGWTVTRTKPNGGVIPCKQLVDRWTNCASFKYACNSPSNDYQVKKMCGKTCEGVQSDEGFDSYGNCAALKAAGRCSEESIKSNCGKTC